MEGVKIKVHMVFVRGPQTPVQDPFLSLSLRVRGGLAVTTATAPSLVAVGCPITSGTHALGSNQDMPEEETNNAPKRTVTVAREDTSLHSVTFTLTH